MNRIMVNQAKRILRQLSHDPVNSQILWQKSDNVSLLLRLVGDSSATDEQVLAIAKKHIAGFEVL